MSFTCEDSTGEDNEWDGMPGPQIVMPGPQTVLSTAALLILANVVETFSQAWFLDKSLKGTCPACREHSKPAESQDQSQASTDSGAAQERQQWRSKHNHPPSANLRLNRFAVTTLLLVPVCIAFALCMSGLPCNKSPQWWAIIVFNIIPFMSACLAWLRTVIDCILTRFDPHSDVLEEYWPRYIIIMSVVMALRGAMRVVMKADDIPNRAGAGDVETGLRRDISEEEQGLMLGDYGSDGDDDQTVYSPRMSTYDDVDQSPTVKAIS